MALGRDTNVLICVKRRLAMCARKLGKLKEAVKMFRDVSTFCFNCFAFSSFIFFIILVDQGSYTYSFHAEHSRESSRSSA